MILLHYLGCLWIFVGSEYFMNYEDGHLPWMYASEDFQDMSMVQLFIYATYWVCTVVTTVGYGDYTGGTTLEYMFSFAIEFCGFIIFAFIQSSILEVAELNYSFRTYVQDLDFQALVWFNIVEKQMQPGIHMPTELHEEIKRHIY